MTSPFVVSPVAYGDAPSGGVVMPMIIAARVPSNTIDKLPAGYWWLSSLDQFIVGPGGTVTYGNGNLYYQAGNSGGLPNWILVSDSSGPIVGINGTANQITATNSSGTVTLSIPVAFIAPGSITSTTTLTATLGNITATNGNLVASTAGTGLQLNATTATGAAASPVVLNARAGQVVFTSVSIAAAADLTLTITNSAITGATTQVICDVSGATTGSALSVKSKTSSNGSLALVITNGTGATTTTADITVTFLVVN